MLFHTLTYVKNLKKYLNFFQSLFFYEYLHFYLELGILGTEY